MEPPLKFFFFKKCRSVRIWNPYGPPKEIFFPKTVDLYSYGTHMEPLRKFFFQKMSICTHMEPPMKIFFPKNVDLYSYGTHMEPPMKIFFPKNVDLYSYGTHMEPDQHFLEKKF